MSLAERLFADVDQQPGFAERTAEKLRLSVWQLRNLVQLARHLRTLPADYKHFAMSDYYVASGPGEWSPAGAATGLQQCGTSACAAGHGPVAGIAPLPEEGWALYTVRAFGGYYSPYTDWLFHPSWDYKDNTPRGAAARIAYALHKPERVCGVGFKLVQPDTYVEYLA
jgi:hypothetical protein